MCPDQEGVTQKGRPGVADAEVGRQDLEESWEGIPMEKGRQRP